MPNKYFQTDQIILSCLLQKAQKTRHYVLAAEERRYTVGVVSSKENERRYT